jgi:hypothetical protein
MNGPVPLIPRLALKYDISAGQDFESQSASEPVFSFESYCDLSVFENSGYNTSSWSNSSASPIAECKLTKAIAAMKIIFSFVQDRFIKSLLLALTSSFCFSFVALIITCNIDAAPASVLPSALSWGNQFVLDLAGSEQTVVRSYLVIRRDNSNSKYRIVEPIGSRPPSYIRWISSVDYLTSLKLNRVSVSEGLEFSDDLTTINRLGKMAGASVVVTVTGKKLAILDLRSNRIASKWSDSIEIPGMDLSKMDTVLAQGLKIEVQVLDVRGKYALIGTIKNFDPQNCRIELQISGQKRSQGSLSAKELLEQSGKFLVYNIEAMAFGPGATASARCLPAAKS